MPQQNIQRPPAAGAEQEYRVGDVVAGLYRVESTPYRGGMGVVYRVHHNDWNVDLAMKRPYEYLFTSKKARELFINECKLWIGLGVHPNIVVCYYVREIDRIPSIFSEWMTGGSLREWIGEVKVDPVTHEEAFHPGRLYDAPDASAIVERILDVAIQTARGLHYAHQRDLIHQDVKPDNILLTEDGAAKVADFGISRARRTATAILDANPAHSRQAAGESVAFSRGYCSPEQVEKRDPTIRTDVWSWAVMLLEMFLVERPWEDGTVAGYGFRRYLQQARYPVPIGLADLLARCFQHNEADRPHDFSDVEMELLVIYEMTFGREYHRSYLEAVDDTADLLNNRALSMLDIGKPAEAEGAWKRATRIDHNHLESFYNASLYAWRNGGIDDLELLRRMGVAAQNHSGDWRVDLLLGRIHLERSDRSSAIESLKRALAGSGGDAEARRLLEEAEAFAEDGVERTFAGLTSGVHALDVLPDESLLLAGCDDHGMILWDARTGAQKRTLIDHTGRILCARFLPGGRNAVSAGEDSDHAVRYWDIERGECLRRLSGHENEVRSLDASPDGRRLLSGGIDATIRLWDLGDGACLRVYRGHELNVTGLRFLPDGKRFVSSSADGTLRLWSTENDECMRVYDDRAGRVLSLDLSRDGTRMLTGAEGGDLRLWNVETGECLRSIRACRDDVNIVRISADGMLAACACEDRRVRFFDLSSGCCTQTLPEQVKGINCFSCSADLSRVYLVCGREITLHRHPTYGLRAGWIMSRIIPAAERFEQEERFQAVFSQAERALDDQDVAKALSLLEQARGIPGHEDDAQCLSLNVRAGRFCAASCVRSVKERPECTAAERAIRSVAISADGSLVLAACDDGTARLFGFQKMDCLRTFAGHGDKVVFARFSGDERRVASYAKDRTMRVWDASNGNELCSFKPYADTFEVLAIGVNQNGTIACAAGDDKQIHLFRTDTGERVQTLAGHADSVGALCFGADGRTVVSGSWDRTLKIWDTDQARAIHTLEGHQDDVLSVCLSIDGKLALSGGYDRAMILWDVENEAPLHRFSDLPAPVTNVNILADGRYLFAGYGDGRMELWDARDHQSVRTFTGHAGGLCSAISADGRCVVSGGGNGTIKPWEIDWVYAFPGWTDWDERARPYLARHARFSADGGEDGLDALIGTLQCNGLGYLRKAAVRTKLKKLRSEEKS